ncbi:MAG: hypothetical protein AB7I68_14035 [Porticoccaceae bacterium]
MTSHYRSNGRLLAAGWLFAIAGVGSAASTTAQEQVDSPHRHDRQERESPETAQSTPFATDAPLRAGMARIRNAVAANRPDDRQRGLSREQATALASEIEQSVNYLFANCRLEPAADAALHGLLAQLLQGAAALRRDPAAEDGIPAVLAALASYPRLFLDAQWQALP